MDDSEFSPEIRIAKALERIADALAAVVGYECEKPVVRTEDMGRARVYATHLGKKLKGKPK